MRLALNIGMLTNGVRTTDGKHFNVPKHNISAARIVSKLALAGFDVRGMNITPGATEDTCSVIVEPWAESYDLVALSIALDQDCIAVVPMVRLSLPATDTPLPVWGHDWTKGALIGPHASEWGTFDRAYFKVCPQ